MLRRLIKSLLNTMILSYLKMIMTESINLYIVALKMAFLLRSSIQNATSMDL